MRPRTTAGEIVIDAFVVANRRRGPAPGTIFRSDHGS